MRKYLIRVAGVAIVLLMTSQVLMADCIPPQKAAPALTEWGMIAVAVALGLGGAYRIGKHRK